MLRKNNYMHCLENAKRHLILSGIHGTYDLRQLLQLPLAEFYPQNALDSSVQLLYVSLIQVTKYDMTTLLPMYSLTKYLMTYNLILC